MKPETTDKSSDPLQTAVSSLRGVGPTLATRLSALGIATVEDLLFHLPIRYEDRTRITPVGALRPFTVAQIEAEVLAADIVFGRRRSLLVKVSDPTGIVTLRFFHFNAAQKNALARGTRLRAFGEARPGASGLEFYHPEYRVLVANEAAPLTDRLSAVYGTTDGVTQTRMRALAEMALDVLARHAPAELLPAGLLARFGLPALRDALEFVHRPPPGTRTESITDGSHPAVRRLALEELAAHQLGMLAVRAELRRHAAPPLPAPDAADPAGIGRSRLASALCSALPFALTGAQRRVLAEIAADMAQPVPMLRLVQGDVGAGKTVVAALAALRAIDAGLQVALMAPTEILAGQHQTTFTRWLAPLGLAPGWLAARQNRRERQAVLAGLADGSTPLAIGTHALFQDDVAFARLGLVIVDEQHRFGVQQRLALRDKAGTCGVAHQLIMTATPIPRTLAMSAYGDLDTSVIDELPPGRTPVQTVVIGEDRRPEVIARIRQAGSERRQAYWVCPLVEASEEIEAQAAESACAELRAALPELRVGLVHGRLKAAEKAAAMSAFQSGDIDLLVATTVIEVGVDVPNASLMVIENAERLGLSQLHQLRGRVGRGATRSFCVLMYHPPLSATGRERLAVMRETNDGFRIAEKDLALRGPGEVLGTRQTGEITLRVADLQRDAALIDTASELANAISRRWPELAGPLIRRWIGEAIRFSRV